MHGGIVGEPVTPRALAAERFDGIRQMLARIPRIERSASGFIGDSGTDDEDVGGINLCIELTTLLCLEQTYLADLDLQRFKYIFQNQY
jgi:hypothetical protein